MLDDTMYIFVMNNRDKCWKCFYMGLFIRC